MGDVLVEADEQGKPLLVHFGDASPQARSILRENRVSFVGDDGSCFLFDPPLVVDREVPPLVGAPPPRRVRPISDSARNPFSRSGSRVLRWLLLHPGEQFSIRTLAERASVSETLVSRVVRSLSEEAWVQSSPNPHDRRARSIRLRRPREALAAWSRNWARKRIAVENWAIRTEDHEAALTKLRSTRKREPGLRWALGGLAGAYQVRRAVEPGSALLWVSALDLDALADSLLPTRSSRANAQLRVAVAPDDFLFDLVSIQAGLPIVDPVQLWLDCDREGERALEAADAIAEAMGW